MFLSEVTPHYGQSQLSAAGAATARCCEVVLHGAVFSLHWSTDDPTMLRRSSIVAPTTLAMLHCNLVAQWRGTTGAPSKLHCSTLRPGDASSLHPRPPVKLHHNTAAPDDASWQHRRPAMLHYSTRGPTVRGSFVGVRRRSIAELARPAMLHHNTRRAPWLQHRRSLEAQGRAPTGPCCDSAGATPLQRRRPSAHSSSPACTNGDRRDGYVAATPAVETRRPASSGARAVSWSLLCNSSPASDCSMRGELLPPCDTVVCSAGPAYHAIPWDLGSPPAP